VAALHKAIDRVPVKEAQALGLLDHTDEPGRTQYLGEIEQHAGDGGDGDPVMGRPILGVESSGAVDGDPGPAPTMTAWDGVSLPPHGAVIPGPTATLRFGG
jgi:hypothetical protein